MLFISPQKLFLFSRYLSFCLDVSVVCRKVLTKKVKVNFKFFYVAVWLTNNCNRHLILFFMFACNNFSRRAYVKMIYWTSTVVLLNLVVPLDSAVPSLDFEQINVFSTSGFDLYFPHSI